VKQVPALAPSKDEIIISTTPTHVVTEMVEVLKAAGEAGGVVHMSAPGPELTSGTRTSMSASGAQADVRSP
jgi:hypothetical protein